MRSKLGNIWEAVDQNKPDAICIPTNDYVKRDGSAVMAVGLAGQAAKRNPDLPHILGEKLATYGGGVHILDEINETLAVSFSTKPAEVTVDKHGENLVPNLRRQFLPGDIAPGWAAMPSLSVIEQSAKDLAWMADTWRWTNVYLPDFSEGFEEIDSYAVRRLLEPHLDDRFTIFYGSQEDHADSFCDESVQKDTLSDLVNTVRLGLYRAVKETDKGDPRQALLSLLDEMKEQVERIEEILGQDE